LAGIAVLILLAALLRLTWLGHLNFRNDESFTLLDARQSWPAVLGFEGFYDYHPPLSFALAKAAALVVPEVLAARTVAAVCAVLTIPVFYALAARLLDSRAALVGSLLLAISPAHIEFSRIGRMYAPMVLAIVCSYWALVAYHQEGRRRWALIYGASLTFAVYLDYSALYALAPQIVPLSWVVWKHAREAIWLLAAAATAVVLYGPWLTQLPPTIDQANEYPARASYLEPSWSSIREAVPWIAAISGGGAEDEADWPNLWARWPSLHELLLLALVPLIIGGLVTLRRQPLALMISLGLLLGTPLTAIVASQISPGFALRTILPASLGWCLMAGAAFSRLPMPRPLRAMAILSCLFLVIASVNALPATYSDRGRTLRVEAAAETVADVAPLGKPIITYSAGGMDTDVIDAFVGDRLAGARIVTFFDGSAERTLGMMPWIDSRPARRDLRDGGLAEILPPSDPNNDALWFFTHRSPRSFHAAFTELGYERLLRLDYARAYLELWALPGADLGDSVAINGAFAGDGTSPSGWTLPTDGPVTVDETIGSLTIHVSDDPITVSQRLDGISPGLYVFEVEVLGGSGEAAGATVQCLSAEGGVLAENAHPEEEPAVEGVEPSALRPAVLCPEGTSSAALMLTSTGESAVTYRNARLSQFQT
jgi:4-amino-4-deoxy-L-arabinose transferase-like glycosyltransferase